MQVLALKLIPRGPFHLGERGVGAEETTDLAHSDTIFSALCWAWRLLYGEESLEDELLASFCRAEPPPFLLSSALPFAGPVRFWPRPTVLPWRPDDEERRALRKVRFVSTSVFSDLVAGRKPAGEQRFIQNGQLWLTTDELEGVSEAIEPDPRLAADFVREWAALGHYDRPAPEDYGPAATRLWQVAEAPHVALDRASSASEIYHIGDVHFAHGCGPYVVVRFLADDGPWQSRLLTAFRLMGDEGLGGRRSIGRGQFDLEVEPVTVPQGDGDRAVLLSLLNPTAVQTTALLQGEAGIAYRPVTRRGWTSQHQAPDLWRKRVTMLAEGSVVARPADGRPPGRLVTVLEAGGVVPHNVYRYGYGFLVPMEVGQHAI